MSSCHKSMGAVKWANLGPWFWEDTLEEDTHNPSLLICVVPSTIFLFVQTINRLTIKRPSSNFVESYLIRPFPVHVLSESKNYCLVQTGKDFAKPGWPCGYLWMQWFFQLHKQESGHNNGKTVRAHGWTMGYPIVKMNGNVCIRNDIKVW